MKLLGRFVFGLLVLLAGMNVFLYSYVDMTMSYLLKYGNLAVKEDRSDAFFSSTYLYYSEDMLIDTQIEGDYDFRLVVYTGSNSRENQLQVRIENKEGLTLPQNYVIRLFLEDDQKNDIIFYDVSSKLWKASYIDMKSILKDQADYLSILDLQIIKIETEIVDDEPTKVETILYDYDGLILVDKADMDIIALSKVNSPDMMRNLGYRQGVDHDFFGEYQFILWRNMAVFMVIVGAITYLLFFRKRKAKNHSYVPTAQTPVKGNLNMKQIEKVKAVDEPKKTNPQK